jgi:hypothetical protein
MLTIRSILREGTCLPQVALLLTLCLAPYVDRLRNPSLYADDVARIADLQTIPIGSMLLRPFNEHLAPLFEALSWVTWQMSGQKLANAPAAFTVASYLPFPLTIAFLAWAVARETGSQAAALFGVSVFSLSWLSIETVYWYSASSFMWALALTLIAWIAISAGTVPTAWIGMLAAAAAPAFSAIGLLAGPVAALRALGARDSSYARRVGLCGAPILGTIFYLAAYLALRHHDFSTPTIDRAPNVGTVLLLVLRAPAVALVPALVGIDLTDGHRWSYILTVVALLGLLWRAVRNPLERPLILGALTLVFGGYLLTFAARADDFGPSVLRTQRYHLFPMVGLALILSGGFARLSSRWRWRSAKAFWVAALFAAILYGSHAREMRGRGRFYRHADQVRTLAAFDRLGMRCVELGITRAQALAALDPIETEWTPRGYSALIMIAPGSPLSRVPGERVRATLLAGLTNYDRKAVCGGMDATPFLEPAADPPIHPVVAVGRRVSRYRMLESGVERYEATGYPAFLEYVMPTSAVDARALVLSGRTPGGIVELWWRGEQQQWSETRSVRLRLPPGVTDSRLALGRLPHWEQAESERIRILFHEAGEIALTAPSLLR